MSKPTKFSIKDIGNTLQLRDEIDPGLKVTNWFRQGLNIVDIYPAAFKLDLTSNNVAFSVYNTGEDSKLGYIDPTKRYQDKCAGYGLGRETTALRLWITGESTFQEEFGNQYETNLIESGINGLVNKVSPLLNTIKGAAAGTGSKIIPQALTSLKSTVDTGVDSILSIAGGSQTVELLSKTVKNIAHLALDKTLTFSYLSIPKTYTGSSYAPSLNFNVRLISPYGAREAIEEFIVKPLTYVLLLSTPTTLDGITYGGATYVTVKAYGISDIPLAIIDNVSIRRGGNDVAYNKYRQPLSIDINVSIKPASDGFAAYMNKNQDGVFSINENEVNHVNGVNGIATSTSNDSPSIININDKGNRSSSMTTVGSVLESLKPMPIFDNKPGQVVMGKTAYNIWRHPIDALTNTGAKTVVRESAFVNASKQSPPSFSKTKKLTHYETRAAREQHATGIISSILARIS